METITLGLFSLILVVCLLFRLPTLYALFAGLILFCAYAAKKGNSPKKIVSMLCAGVLTAKNILIVFLLIGMMTALWRACGTIPYIICHAAKLLRPEVILLVFLPFKLRDFRADRNLLRHGCHHRRDLHEHGCF